MNKNSVATENHCESSLNTKANISGDDFEKEFEKLLISKDLPRDLVEYGLMLLPEMINIFGKEKILKFLKEYKIIARDRSNPNSGLTNRVDKVIEADWIGKNLHEAVILYLHEAGHAIGELKANPDSLLMEGQNCRESFFRKLEESVVSERQNELEQGELNYDYYEVNNLENDEDFHLNNFKTQSAKYYINNVFYKNIQILLGNNRGLIQKMMYADTLEEKDSICNTCIGLIREQLSDEDFLKLKDCICTFVLNFTYSSDKTTIADYIKNDNNFNEEMTKEEFMESLVHFFPKNARHLLDRHLLDKNIFDAVDDLCGITLGVLLNRLSNPEYNDFSALKEGCEYFTKIYNTSENLSQQTAELKAIIENKLNKKVPSLISSLTQKGFDEKERFKVLTAILSKKDLQEEDLPKITIDKKDVITIPGSKVSKFEIVKKPTYADMFRMVLTGRIIEINQINSKEVDKEFDDDEGNR